MSKNHLTPLELVERLGLAAPDKNGRGGGIGTLANWRCRGGGPSFIKLGKKIRYPLECVVAWEKERTFENSAQERLLR